MNAIKYLLRQFRRLKIDLLTQQTFLAGDVLSIDDNIIIKTASTNYEELEIIFFKYLAIKPQDVIIDVGCGKGRVFSYLLYKGLKNKMIGYEINLTVGEATKKRLIRYKNVGINCENIFDDFPKEGNIFYLYHPFKEPMMMEFINQLLQITEKDPVVLYNNPVYIDLFKNEHFNCQVFNIPVSKYGYHFSFAAIRLKK